MEYQHVHLYTRIIGAAGAYPHHVTLPHYGPCSYCGLTVKTLAYWYWVVLLLCQNVVSLLFDLLSYVRVRRQLRVDLIPTQGIPVRVTTYLSYLVFVSYVRVRGRMETDVFNQKH